MLEIPSPSETEHTLFRHKGQSFRSEGRYKLPLAYFGYMRFCSELDCQHMIWPVNLSTRGIGFLHAKPIQEGTRCQIRLPNSNGSDYQIYAVVQHCTEQVSRDWLVGCALEEPLDAAALDALLQVAED